MSYGITDFNFSIKIIDQFIQYKVSLPNQSQEKVQPVYIMLESCLKYHHFLHWDLSAPTVSVKVSMILTVLDSFNVILVFCLILAISEF